MAITLTLLKSRQQDYFLAGWEDDELVMEPFCHCGNVLAEDFYCSRCERECDCNFIACTNPQAFSVVEKLVNGNPSFRNYTASLLDK